MNPLDQAKLWLVIGERCDASETIFSVCSGSAGNDVAGDDIPRTLEDLRRCRLLLEQCPGMKSKLHRVGHLSKQWAEIISFWDDLCMVQELEDPDWRDKAGKAPKTTLMLKTIIERTNS